METMNYNDHLREQAVWDEQAAKAQSKAAQAFARLLEIADHDTGQAARVRRFIAASFNGNRFAFDLFDLRAMDVEISNDVLACMDALRWARADLYKLVPDGLERVQSLIVDWGMGPISNVSPDA